MGKLRFKGSVWINLDIALRNLNYYYDHETKKLGLKVIEWYMLRSLYVENEQTVAQLGGNVGLPSTAFTPFLDKLVEKGFIERVKNPKHRGSALLKLTDKAYDFQEEVTAIATRIENELRTPFSDKDWQGYLSALITFQTIGQEKP